MLLKKLMLESESSQLWGWGISRDWDGGRVILPRSTCIGIDAIVAVAVVVSTILIGGVRRFN